MFRRLFILGIIRAIPLAIAFGVLSFFFPEFIVFFGIALAGFWTSSMLFSVYTETICKKNVEKLSYEDNEYARNSTLFAALENKICYFFERKALPKDIKRLEDKLEKITNNDLLSANQEKKLIKLTNKLKSCQIRNAFLNGVYEDSVSELVLNQDEIDIEEDNNKNDINASTKRLAKIKEDEEINQM